MNSTVDWLSAYTAPRALLIGVLFVAAVAFRVAALPLALGVHVLDRLADRVVGWADRMPPAPVRTVTRPTNHHGPRGRKQR